MEPLARWIRKEFERSQPWPLILIAFLAALPCGIAIPEAVLGNVWFPILAVLILVAGCTPMVRHVRRNRHRPPMPPLIRANYYGRLAETIGPRSEQLNTAAANLEQIAVALERYGDETIPRKELILAAEAHMRRMLELTVGAPANYGLTQQRAGEQINADGEWLERARSLTERLALPAAEREANDHLIEDLNELAAAREEAIQELNA